ncbi:hypothetical protein [Ferrovibrio xuzhouensis]|uniref:HTH cro/C1-type domain-containing protein n=1 Tax=Ferrovibrio xuzhouensis TaxID=1576914 RepID=A0ABV7VDU2_9PROT
MVADKNTQVRREALKLLAQVEKQGLEIAERYRDGADMTGDYRGFRNFIEKVDHFYVFVDLVEERLPQFESDKHAALAKHLAEIRWRITIVEVDTTQIFLVRIGEARKPWPLGSRQFLERRLTRLGEIAEYYDEFGETYQLPELGGALMHAVEDLLKAQITRAPGLDDFSADFRSYSAISATPARSLRRPEDFVTSRGADAARAKLPGYRTAAFRVREMDGRFFAERDSISAVAEACRVSHVSMDDLARQLGMSRPALALILSGSDPMSSATLEGLRKFLTEVRPA